jgi:hypothetical protein
MRSTAVAHTFGESTTTLDKEGAMKLSNPHHFERMLAGACLVLAPLLLLASSAVSPAIKSDEGAQLAVIARHPDRFYLFSVLGLASSVLLVPALLGLMGMLRERAPGWGYVGVGLMMLGNLLSVGDWMSNFVQWQMAIPEADRGEMTALLTRLDETTGSALPLQLSGFAFLVGTAALAIGLFRARAVPAWSALGLVVGIVLNLAGFIVGSVPLRVVGAAVLFIAMGWIGRIVLADSKADWERSSHVPSARPAADTP